MNYRIFNFLPLKQKAKESSKREFVKFLIHDMRSTEVGYAGYRTKKYLRLALNSYLSDDQSKLDLSQCKFTQSQVKTITLHIKKVAQEASHLLPLQKEKEFSIFLFPTLSVFTKENLGGINGFTPYQRVFNLYIHPESVEKNNFPQELKSTALHEYNHAIRFIYCPLNSCNTLTDGIVNEGLAENFSHAIQKKKSRCATVLSKQEAKKIFHKITPLLDSKKSKVFDELFFAGKKFPLWAGYAIGYYIVEAFLQKYPQLSWKEIIRMPATRILQESGWNA